MTATADKARYFLEQSVPELKEYESKKIFSADEITRIAKSRSDFEHKINARGSVPNDYIQYASFEMSVEALRKKRIKRHGIKSTAHNGQRRIFFVFDRGTRKFPGNVELWIQSIQHCRRQKAYKKLSQTLTNALRMHPTKPELWIYAAACAMEEKGDMNEARSYMQRALRFVKRSRSLWIEYARLELAYMAKIHARRRVLGIGNQETQESTDTGVENEDMISLPRLTTGDVNPTGGNDHEVDETALRNLDNTPIMSGAIPITIFDAAMIQFKDDVAFAHQFFDMVSEFEEVPVATKILQHVLDNMRHMKPKSWQIFACDASIALFQIPTSSPDFPEALRASFRCINEGMSHCSDKALLSSWFRKRLERLLDGNLDPALDIVLRSKLASLD